MIRILYVAASLPAVIAASIATPWRPNPKSKRGEMLSYIAFAYLVLYFVVFHFWLRAF